MCVCMYVCACVYVCMSAHPASRDQARDPIMAGGHGLRGQATGQSQVSEQEVCVWMCDGIVCDGIVCVCVFVYV